MPSVEQIRWLDFATNRIYGRLDLLFPQDF